MILNFARQLVKRSGFTSATITHKRPSCLYRHFSSITEHSDSIHVNALHAVFPYIWLRDSCQCSKCVHPSTRQKLHKSSDFPPDIRPIKGSVRAQNSPDGIAVEWSSNGEDGSHRSFYDADFLKSVSSLSDIANFHREVSAKPWIAKEIAELAKSTLSIPFDELSSKSRLLSSLKLLKEYGIIFIKKLPTADTSDSGCELQKLAAIIGEIRSTFYGYVWDVRNVRHSKNIAYTNLDLDLHMDLL